MNRVLNPKTGRMVNDLSGMKFGRWTVGPCVGNRGLQTLWECRCGCGVVKEVPYNSLTSGGSESCGCLRTELRKKMFTTHGRSKTRLYNAWQQMRDRCYNESRPAWKDYGGRGITVCEKWNTSFEAFAEDMGDPPYGESLDRIDNDGNYEPGNCKWSTRQEQQRNKRTNVWFDWKGEQRTLTDIARMENVAYCSFRNKVAAQVDVAIAIKYCKARGLKFNERAEFLLGGELPKRGERRRRPDITPRRQIPPNPPYSGGSF